MTLWNMGLLKHWEQTWLESRVIKMQKALEFAFYPCLILGQQAAEDIGDVFVDLRKVSSPPRLIGFMNPNKNMEFWFYQQEFSVLLHAADLLIRKSGVSIPAHFLLCASLSLLYFLWLSPKSLKEWKNSWMWTSSGAWKITVHLGVMKSKSWFFFLNLLWHWWSCC